MEQLESLKAFFAKDRFVLGQGMEIEEVGPGRAVCAAAVEDRHKNGNGVAQGGFVYTLADFAFAVAANADCPGSVTLDSTLHFLRPATGGRLTATAAKINGGRTVCVYNVEVADEQGRLVAAGSFTGFVKEGMGPARQSGEGDEER